MNLLDNLGKNVFESVLGGEYKKNGWMNDTLFSLTTTYSNWLVIKTSKIINCVKMGFETEVKNF